MSFWRRGSHWWGNSMSKGRGNTEFHTLLCLLQTSLLDFFVFSTKRSFIFLQNKTTEWTTTVNGDFTNMQIISSELTAGCSWPLRLTARSGELVDRRLSHSLGRGSGTDSIKLLLSSLILVWWRMISVWVLSRSFKNEKVTLI